MKSKQSKARLDAARDAVAKFHKRFPDWDELQGAYLHTISRKANEAIEQLIRKAIAKKIKPSEQYIRALKIKFKTPALRRAFLWKRAGVCEDEVLSGGFEPIDFHELPMLQPYESRYLDYPEPEPESGQSISVVQRAMNIGVGFGVITDAVNRAHRTTKGTLRYKSAERHLKHIEQDKQISEEAESAASAPFVLEWKVDGLRSKPTPKFKITF